ncbi:RnfABCDGE type electron transport complex subunit B [Natranaerobius thermophilus]|uniref:Ion-translocating oxidoreductase complex subunit B n=1 Tax=Natranaerobius thermophilus (strain ATCC BAA-1301 / DSM 18059 / JW/NM-WN-LF) TaxID=457570 RepID=B2A147_NATTJ|nr:RnfABCDGE type electron transport complex subunit B [Natranaerobius thermophilus]ACB84670.1 electron transport complex, RnfABCDGE type, B subunit [Natranaerobius thermophilus JW/NM-WN-LF]
MIEAVLSLGAIAFIFGSVLAYAAEKFKVEKDPRIEAIAEVVPGANCGACGYPGCEAFAEAVARGEAPPEGCTPGGKKAAEQISEILSNGAGESNEFSTLGYVKETNKVIQEPSQKYIAEVACLGSREYCKEKFEYDGVRDCRAAMMYRNGPKACEFGCIGLATCVETCPFEAIEMRDDGLPRINHDICRGCATCVNTCPKSVIRLIPGDRYKHFIYCNSQETGEIVKENCQYGCLGCGICREQCPVGAINLDNDLAVIDQNKCVNCGLCKDKCPTACIVSESERLQ